jgi:hypothetical protein
VCFFYRRRQADLKEAGLISLCLDGLHPLALFGGLTSYFPHFSSQSGMIQNHSLFVYYFIIFPGLV